VAKATYRVSRIACVVPFCGRGTTRVSDPSHNEYLCPEHYRLVDAGMKRLRAKARKRGHYGLVARCWQRMVAQAVERAGGHG
jgi:hypothetical protein